MPNQTHERPLNENIRTKIELVSRKQNGLHTYLLVELIQEKQLYCRKVSTCSTQLHQNLNSILPRTKQVLNIIQKPKRF